MNGSANQKKMKSHEGHAAVRKLSKALKFRYLDFNERVLQSFYSSILSPRLPAPEITCSVAGKQGMGCIKTEFIHWNKLAHM